MESGSTASVQGFILLTPASVKDTGRLHLHRGRSDSAVQPQKRAQQSHNIVFLLGESG